MLTAVLELAGAVTVTVEPEVEPENIPLPAEDDQLYVLDPVGPEAV